MKTLRFNNDDTLPILGLGTWKSEPGDVYNAVTNALKIGYRHIDCAPIYGNEAEVGRALRGSFEKGVVSREQTWITSKLWNNAHAQADVKPALQKTLEDLQIDYLDLFLIHWPVALRKNVVFPKTAADMVALEDLPLLETWNAMEDLVHAGMCRHIGVSNFSIPKLKNLLNGAKIKPEMNQIELHPYLQQLEMLEFCKNNDIQLTAYSPLGSLDRPVALKADDEPELLEDPTIAQIAKVHDATPAQILISWAIHRGTAVIPKSIQKDHMAQNLAAAEIALSAEDMQKIAALDRKHRYVNGSFWAMPGSPYTLVSLWGEQ